MEICNFNCVQEKDDFICLMEMGPNLRVNVRSYFSDDDAVVYLSKEDAVELAMDILAHYNVVLSS